MDFGLERLKVDKDATARYTPSWLDGGVLICKPGTSENKEFHLANNSVTIENATKRLNKARKDGSDEDIRKAADRVNTAAVEHYSMLFPEHIIVGWEKVVDSGGKPVEFSKEAASTFCRQLAVHTREFLQFVNWVIDADTFRDTTVAVEDLDELVEAVAGN